MVENTANIQKVELYDASGKLIKVVNDNSKKTPIFINHNGWYLLKISSEGKETVKKILK